jgi:hypothetical protein
MQLQLQLFVMVVEKLGGFSNWISGLGRLFHRPVLFPAVFFALAGCASSGDG